MISSTWRSVNAVRHCSLRSVQSRCRIEHRPVRGGRLVVPCSVPGRAPHGTALTPTPTPRKGERRDRTTPPHPPTPMPLRKSHLYSSLWQSCDQLRGGMDASQYKDYVLTLLFMKYVSDKYAGSDDFADITVPPGGGFDDMVDAQGDQGDR